MISCGFAHEFEIPFRALHQRSLSFASIREPATARTLEQHR